MSYNIDDRDVHVVIRALEIAVEVYERDIVQFNKELGHKRLAEQTAREADKAAEILQKMKSTYGG